MARLRPCSAAQRQPLSRAVPPRRDGVGVPPVNGAGGGRETQGIGVACLSWCITENFYRRPWVKGPGPA